MKSLPYIQYENNEIGLVSFCDSATLRLRGKNENYVSPDIYRQCLCVFAVKKEKYCVSQYLSATSLRLLGKNENYVSPDIYRQCLCVFVSLRLCGKERKILCFRKFIGSVSAVKNKKFCIFQYLSAASLRKKSEKKIQQNHQFVARFYPFVEKLQNFKN